MVGDFGMIAQIVRLLPDFTLAAQVDHMPDRIGQQGGQVSRIEADRRI